MDRRATLSALLGQKTSARTSGNQNVGDIKTVEKPLVFSGLEPYLGPWEFEQAAHLLRRTTFGPTNAMIKDAAAAGLDAVLDQLFAAKPLPDPPVNPDFEEDPNVPVGETWIDAPYQESVNVKGYRNRSLRAWTTGLILQEGVSIREKLVLFWHNHFVTANINDPKYNYRYITLFRENAWGNFRELTKKITVDPSMLRYLNGNQNTGASPNENYARELLELFTIGKGELAGPGDYTNYTEVDVVQIARVLTGWRDIGFSSVNPDVQIHSVFIPNRHDKEAKKLSHRFDEVIITNMGEEEYAHLIDLIFSKDEVARFISRKLYRWFVYYTITDAIEADVIEPMAQILLQNDFEIRPALEALLRSQHFFDILNVGPMIKNPIDFVLSFLKQFEAGFPEPLAQKYRHWFLVGRVLPALQMEYYSPPSVAGWKAYYQEPGFYRMWINSVTLPIRMEVTNLFINQGLNAAGARTSIDVLKFVEKLLYPTDPNSLIMESAAILFPQPITENQLNFLKEILIPGLPDFEWTVE